MPSGARWRRLETRKSCLPATIPDSDPKRCYGLGVFPDSITFVNDVREPCLYEWNNTYGFNPQVYDKHWVSFDGQWQTEKYFDSPLVHTFFKPKDADQ